jgi:hypothetical protein
LYVGLPEKGRKGWVYYWFLIGNFHFSYGANQRRLLWDFGASPRKAQLAGGVEARIKNARTVEGQYFDAIKMGILRGEWAKLSTI